jgi:hypothetical protein
MKHARVIDLDAAGGAPLYLFEGTWRFLEDLGPLSGNKAVSEIIGSFSEALCALAAQAEEFRSQGMLGHSTEVLRQHEGLRRKRAEMLAKFSIAVESSAVATAGTVPRCWDAAAVAAELHAKHFCVLDGFVPDAANLHAVLRSMKQSGALQPGEVSGGLQQTRRGDLMRWVSTAPGAQPPALYALLSAIDDLVTALASQPLLASELGGSRMLVRHEMQCTCYPVGGRYVRHVDDALKHRGRILTVIGYCNAGWSVEHGGCLRIHAKDGPFDVAPLEGRLVLFWSDSRCPHEVLPAREVERYAVSVWFSEADAIVAAAAAERSAAKPKG